MNRLIDRDKLREACETALDLGFLGTNWRFRMRELIEIIPELLDELAASKAQAAELAACLDRFVDDDPCQYDHHGYCQAHGLSKPCRNAEARRLIGLPPV